MNSRTAPRAVIVCPGRGAYTAAALGSLRADHAKVQRAEELRAGYALEPLLALDGAERFEPARHLRPANASPLI
ncbi:MAG TPA: ACP S-malonyltransferase, partial [Candidatus Dormibacteraeota bacterium]|nr:ACP S-malonyltransferase [Candidatus Dormibacteraeota bacterium]